MTAEPGYEFYGNELNFYFLPARDSGDMVFTVDGGEERHVRTWDRFCPDFNRIGSESVVFLPEGRHTLRLRVADTHVEGSGGYAIRLAAFMIR